METKLRLINALIMLDLKPPVTFYDVKVRYRELAKKLHPDSSKDDNDIAFRSVLAAFKLLQDFQAKIEWLDEEDYLNAPKQETWKTLSNHKNEAEAIIVEESKVVANEVKIKYVTEEELKGFRNLDELREVNINHDGDIDIPLTFEEIKSEFINATKSDYQYEDKSDYQYESKIEVNAQATRQDDDLSPTQKFWTKYNEAKAEALHQNTQNFKRPVQSTYQYQTRSKFSRSNFEKTDSDKESNK